MADVNRVAFMRNFSAYPIGLMTNWLPFKSLYKKDNAKTKTVEYILTNMAGPKNKWKFFGGEL